MKKNKIIAALIVAAIIAGGGLTYRGYAVEQEKQKAETIYMEAKIEAERIQQEEDQRIVASWEDKAYTGVSIFGVDVSGLTREEVSQAIESTVKEKLLSQTVMVSAKDQEFSLTFNDAGITLDQEKLTEEAIGFGKDQSQKEKIHLITHGVEEDLQVTYGLNEESITTFINNVKNEVNQNSKNATITRADGAFTISEHAEGRIINEDKLRADVKLALEEMNTDEKIMAEIVTENPKITSDSLRMINGELSSYTTSYASSAAGRKYNVGFAASKINGAVVMPGETFSYNQGVGPVTASAGFKNAGIYVGNKVEEGIGGGLCQVSSTLYQAALHSNMSIEQRRNHSMAVSYLSPGMDAVVYGTALDLKFTNPYPNPVYISAYGDNSKLNIKIYGHTEDLGGKSYKIFSETTSVLSPKTIRQDDPNLPVGKEEVEQKAVTGYTSKTYKQTIENGTVIKTEVISQDKYKVVDKIIRVGTKAAVAVAPVAPVVPEVTETPAG